MTPSGPLPRQNPDSSSRAGSRGRAKVEKGIRETAPGVYEVQVFLGRDPITGRSRHRTRTVRGGIEKARDELARLRVAKSDTALGPPSAAGTVGALLTEWLEVGERSGKWEQRTLDEYRRKVEVDIRPAIGRVRLDRLTARHLDHYYATLTERGLSPRTVQHYHRCISTALNQGVKWGYLPKNVAQLASPPKAKKAEVRAPSPHEVATLIAHAEQSRAPYMAVAIELAAVTGMREGELCGLQWLDLDEKTRSLHVRRSIWESRGSHGIKTPKSGRTRVVPLGDATTALLLARRGEASSAAERAGASIAPASFIFSPDVDGSSYRLPNAMSQAFTRYCRQLRASPDAGHVGTWDLTFHSLRHYFATQLLAAGASVVTVADLLGHADGVLVMTTYGEDTPNRSRRAGNILEEGIMEAKQSLA